MKIKKKVAIFIALISMFYCVSLIQSTYAKYVTSATGTTNLTIARWKIVVNNQDVTNNSDFSSTITPAFISDSNIRSGVLAPTSQGYFDIIIDATDVDVSMSYTIDVSHSSLNTVSDLNILSYTIDNVTTTYTGAITNQILLTDQVRTKTVRFNVEWFDGTGEDMDNSDDTTAADEGVAALDVDIDFIQLPTVQQNTP